MSKLFTFQGRLGRLAYFGYFVFWVLLAAIAALAAQVLGGVLAFILIAVVGIAMIWGGFSVTARRLHDLDMSGWHYLWMTVVPAAVTSWGQAEHAEPVAAIGGLLSLIFTLFLMFWPGSRGRNSYG